MSSERVECGRARRALWPDGGPRSATPEVLDAQEHFAACTECQRFVRDMLALKEIVHEGAMREQAPREARGRLFTAIARARAGAQPSSRSRMRLYSRAAMAVVLVAVAGGLAADRLLRDADDDPLSAIAADHALALRATHIVSADPDELTRWLVGQVQFAMHVPLLPGARLRGARLCVMDGRRGAVVEYEVNGVAVSYFVMPTGSGQAQAAGPARFAGTTRAGYRVVSWSEPGLLHAMVGNLSEGQLATLAKSCVDQARRMVAWLIARTDTLEG